MSRQLEKEFHAAMADLYRRIRTEIKRYNPSRFREMLEDDGGVAAARSLLSSKQVSPGFLTLLEHNRLDLAVEAEVIKERWRPLFSDQEIRIARDRLNEHGYAMPAANLLDVPDKPSLSFPTLLQIAEEINTRAVTHRIGKLQTIRKELTPGSRSGRHTLFDTETDWVKADDYAFHFGGRHELQFNIGFEEIDGERLFRHGVAFSLERSQWVHDVVETLLPKIERFNEFFRVHFDLYDDLQMWYWQDGRPSSPSTPGMIGEHMAAPESFIMLGRRTSKPPIDIERILADFDRLVPLYRFVEGNERFPTLDSSITGIFFSPGHHPGKHEGVTTLQRDKLDVQLRHNRLQTRIYEHLVAEFGKGRVGTEQRNGPGNRVDVVVRTEEGYWYYELKLGSSARSCIRQGIGQLLEYSYWPTSQVAQRLVLVGEVPADLQEMQYLELLRTKHGLPIFYQWFDDTDGVLRSEGR